MHCKDAPTVSGLSKRINQRLEGGQEGAILAGHQQGAAVVPQVHRRVVHHPPLAKPRPQLRPPQEASGGVGRQRLDPVPEGQRSEEEGEREGF